MFQKIASFVLTCLLCLTLVAGPAGVASAQSNGWLTNQYNQNLLRQQQAEQLRRQQAMEQQRRQQEQIRRQQQIEVQRRQQLEAQRRQQEQLRQQQLRDQQRQRQLTADRLREQQTRNQTVLRQDRQRQDQLRLRRAEDQRLRDRAAQVRRDNDARLARQRVAASRPPTTAELRKGFRGRFLPDGRAIVTARGKTFVVKASLIGVRPPLRAGASARAASLGDRARPSLRGGVSRGAVLAGGYSNDNRRSGTAALHGTAPQGKPSAGDTGTTDKLMILARSSSALIIGPTASENGDILGLHGARLKARALQAPSVRAANDALGQRIQAAQGGIPNENFTRAQRIAAKRWGVDARWIEQDGKLSYPTPGSGFEGSPRPLTLLPGRTFDRYGGILRNGEVLDWGSYASPIGTTISERALTPGHGRTPRVTYEVLKPLPVLVGTARAWYGASGGGEQYKFGEDFPDEEKPGKICTGEVDQAGICAGKMEDATVDNLIKHKYIKILKIEYDPINGLE